MLAGSYSGYTIFQTSNLQISMIHDLEAFFS